MLLIPVFFKYINPFLFLFCFCLFVFLLLLFLLLFFFVVFFVCLFFVVVFVVLLLFFVCLFFVFLLLFFFFSNTLIHVCPCTINLYSSFTRAYSNSVFESLGNSSDSSKKTTNIWDILGKLSSFIMKMCIKCTH